MFWYVYFQYFLQFLVFICKVEVQWGRKGETQLGRDNRGSQQRKTNIEQKCKMVKKSFCNKNNKRANAIVDILNVV